MHEQRAASTALSQNVETVAQMSDENSTAIVSVARIATDLVAVSDALREGVSSFRV